MTLRRLLTITLVDLLLLYGVTLMYARGEVAFAFLLLVLAACGSWLLISKKHDDLRFLFPCLVLVATFIVLPLIYTTNIAFTNYSADHKLSYERARAELLAKSWHPDGETYRFKLFREGPGLRLMLMSNTGSEEHFLSGPIADHGDVNVEQTVSASVSIHRPAGAELLPDEISKTGATLTNLVIRVPDGTELTMLDPHTFGPNASLYQTSGDRPYPDQSLALINNRTGTSLNPNMATGYFTGEDSTEPVGPGFIANIGWDNFIRIFTDPTIHTPLLKNFVWSVTFATASVALALAIGLLLAVLLRWEPLHGNEIYRFLLVLPYAIPMFIAALMFRDLFSQSVGGINLLFDNELLAKTVVIVVNTWLSYPYMMILCTGLLTSIADELYEASAIDGASPLQNLVHITIPMISKPLVPALIVSFAFNFNNLVLIAMLTDGSPHIPDSPVGATDVVAGYAYQTAFVNQDYGLAAAVATLTFVLMGAIAWINLLATKRLR